MLDGIVQLILPSYLQNSYSPPLELKGSMYTVTGSYTPTVDSLI